MDEPMNHAPARGAERPFRVPVEGGEIAGHLGGAGPRMLLLHGGPGMNVDYLVPLARELAAAFTVARYQQRGLAPSLTGGSRDVAGHVADAMRVLDGLSWDRAWIVGHSWGGHLAMHLAVAHPERVAGLVVIDALGALPDGGAAAMGETMRAGLSKRAGARLAELDAREERGEATVEDQGEALGLVWPYYFADPAKAPPMPAVRFDLEGHAATWASVAEHWERRTLERELPALKGMSALFIHGERDPIPAEEARRGAALLPGARLEILPGVGHFPWVEAPGVTRELISEVVRSAGTPRG